MGTIVEKIFSAKLGREVAAGEMVMVDVDASMIQDMNGPSVVTRFEGFADVVKSPGKHLMALDHFSPCPTGAAANNHIRMREFARRHEICDVIEEGQGICHQRMIESGSVKPGCIVVGTDSHCCHYGVLNAFGVGIDAVDEAVVLACDRCWFKVPETILVKFTGKPGRHVTSKDLALVMIRELTQSGAIYQCLEFCGDTLGHLSMDGRSVICNMAIEAGAKGAVMPFDDTLRGWLEARGITGYTPVSPDSNANYVRTLEIDVSAVEPVVAVPPEIDHVVPVRQVCGQTVNEVFIGGCTNGRMEDFEQAAAVLKGKKVTPSVRLFAAPASREIALRMEQTGIYKILLEAGANILPPGCGPCTGLHGGIIGDNEVVLSTTNRNVSGRMGSREGRIFICSPVVAAYSALAGEITVGGVR